MFPEQRSHSQNCVEPEKIWSSFDDMILKSLCTFTSSTQHPLTQTKMVDVSIMRCIQISSCMFLRQPCGSAFHFLPGIYRQVRKWPLHHKTNWGRHRLSSNLRWRIAMHPWCFQSSDHIAKIASKLREISNPSHAPSLKLRKNKITIRDLVKVKCENLVVLWPKCKEQDLDKSKKQGTWFKY